MQISGNDPSPDGSAAGKRKPASELGTLLKLAWPLILSNSFSTVQITIDRILLSKLSPDAVSAQTSAVMLFWCPFIVLFSTANYVNTFVAQYFGAGKHQRVGAAVWQGIYFSLIAGFAAIACTPLADAVVSVSQHSPAIRDMEGQYFICLCWMAMPVLIMATVSAFFSGRGSTRVVIWINLVGTAVNALLGWCLIFGNWGLPALGIAGAGWATVIASWVSAVLAVALMMRRKHREEFATFSAWRWDRALFGRLMRFGLPSGFQWMLDTTAFTAFLIMMGWFGDAELGASSIAYTINCVVFIPMIGVGQSVSILVGQHLGQNRPALAVRSTWAGLLVTFSYMLIVGSLFVIIPSAFIEPFRSDADPRRWQAVADLLPKLLWFVFLYSLFDSLTLTFSFALRGAGDTLFVTLVSLCLAWPLMVIPTWLAWKLQWGIYAGWTFVTLFILAQGVCFMQRFRGGKWQSMRVIESSLSTSESMG